MFGTDGPSQFPRNYTAVDVNGTTLARNLIIHPNGNIYGNLRRVACNRWRALGATLYLLDQSGKDRMMLHLFGDTLVSTAGMRLVPQADFPSRNAFEIVVAHYKEDVAWLDCYTNNTIIYSKNTTNPDGAELPNIGREASTYLFHIVKNYDALADRTLFMQGEPFDHKLLALSSYATEAGSFVSANLTKVVLKGHVPRYAKTIDEATMRSFLEMLECNPEMSDFEVVWGAQFAVTRESIRRRSRKYYQRLLDLAHSKALTVGGRTFDDHHVAFLFEFFWRNIFVV